MNKHKTWTTKAGLIAVVRLVRGRYYCGYVGVNSTHPAYNKDYDEEEIYSLDVHGGVTFADEMTTMGVEVDEPTWFIGFDCAHSGDGEFPTIGKDGIYSYTSPLSLGKEPKSLEFCIEQCESLASQLMEMVKTLPAP